MKAFAMTLCTAIMMSTNAMAQKPTPTFNDLIPGGSTYRFTQDIYGLQWWGDTCIKPEIDSLFAIHPQTGRETLVITREAINQALKANQLKQLAHLQHVSLRWPGEEKMWIPQPSGGVVYHFGAQKVISTHLLPAEATHTDYCKESDNIAYTIWQNLYVNDIQVTDEPEGVVCGQAVHRNEFGIHKGTFWSPKGTQLAFYRMDERMLAQYPLVDITTRIAQTHPTPYPMAGMESHKVSIGIFCPATQQTVYLNTGDPTDRYFTNISWSPDEKNLYLIELNRDQNHAKLCRYNAETGELDGIILEESHPKYVEPQRPIVFLPWDSGKFIYQSQRDGFNHLYLYNTKGELIKPLTSGNWLVQEVLDFNEKQKEVIIRSTEHSPLQSNLFRISVTNGKRTPIGNSQGVHEGVLSASGRYLIDKYTAPNTPRSISLINTQQGKEVNLLTADDPYSQFEMPTIETGTIKAADGVTDLHYRLIKPTDFDPNKQYPTIVYVYGGPHDQVVQHRFRYAARGWEIYMATKGYVMFALDNRGSENRGLEFENCTFRQLGIEEGKDQMKGVEFLTSLPFVDANRIGVHGWSYGGYMTTALMLRYPETFKVGVAGGPVIDWKYYEAMYGERYMDTPESNPEGYEKCNLNTLAGNLAGHLLLIHGDQDYVCVPQHTLSFMKSCVEARTYPDLFFYPGHGHGVRGYDRVHLHEKITRYFEAHL